MINIVLAADAKYAQHLAVVATSVLCNTQKPENVTFFVLCDNISEKDINRIDKTIKNHQGHCQFFDLSQDNRFTAMFTSAHISKAAYLRLDIANILPNEVDKVIYLDVDTIVFDDVADLWMIDFEDNPVAAVCDYGIMASKRFMRDKVKKLGFKENEPYFNSGLLLIDLKKWRREKYSEKAISLATEKSFLHHDQDVLNVIFKEKWVKLPLRWNVIPPIYNLFLKVLMVKEYREEAVFARKNKALMHYAGRYKPWEFKDSGEFNHAYYKYLGKTEFKVEKMPKPGNMKGKSLLRQLFRYKMAGFLAKILE